RYQTAVADRGDVAEVVGATGTLQAVTTVQVGSQVSGTIQVLHADFNSQVTKGQVLARLDPSSFEARLGQARANLVAAQASVERQRAMVEDTRQKYERAKELAAENLLPRADLETAKSNHEGAAAQLKATQAAVTQAAAAVRQADVDLAHTVITSPIDGVVVARNVDVGQTVAASLQAPTLFVIANDLSQMQVSASIDEADVGRVRSGQEAAFRVDAYPSETFRGRVEQVRLQPITAQNVVTYNTIIAADNPGQKLMPGMTATVSIIVQESRAALRIPASALRFRPEGFEEARQARTAEGGAPPADAAPSGSARGGAAGAGGGERRRRFREGGTAEAGDRGPRTRGASAGGAGEGGERRGRPALLFTAGPDGKPQPVRVRVGISDGQFVEVLSGLEEGARVVTGVAEAGRTGSPRPGATAGTNPFAPAGGPQRRQR
ncbi:MAG TPA: efflux RND transporter periplasmic adaptor subunit, partial [Vicinamibacteria bacterium]|nr:efflux RND transporter periplasmic adaptor subunit [Vicinamibacteria bacterium]